MEKETDKDAVASMNAEAKETGFKPVFVEDEEKPKSPKENENSSKDEKEESNKDADKGKVDDSKNSRQSRAPLKELRERMQKGLEDKFTEKFGKEISELKSKLNKYEKGELTPKQAVNLQDDIKAVAKELNLDENALGKITGLARKGLEDQISEMEVKLSKYEKADQEKSDDKIIEEQTEIFKDEWDSVLPALKEKYPNATKEQLNTAKDMMDELAHSEDHAEHELDYIFFKEGKQFEKILFSPKSKGFEDDSSFETDDEEKDEADIFSGKAPTSFKELEKISARTNKFEDSLEDTRFRKV